MQRKGKKRPARFTFRADGGTKQAILLSYIIFSHHSISPDHPNQEGGPAPALQGPPRSSTSALSATFDTIFFFIYYTFSSFLDPLFRDLDSLNPDVRGVAIYRILVEDCSSDAQMRRSTFSPHWPRLQQLAGSASCRSCALLTTLRSSQITCNAPDRQVVNLMLAGHYLS